MSFFMSTRGVIHPYEFRYLQPDFEKARLEPTMPIGIQKEKMEMFIEGSERQLFAIDVMSKMVKHLPLTAHLDDIRDLMKTKMIRHVPIVSDHKLIGMVSDRDLLKVDMSGTFSFLKAEDVMTSLVVVALDETPLANIARVLLEEKISAIPVIDKKYHLVGMITISDILSAVVYNKLIFK